MKEKIVKGHYDNGTSCLGYGQSIDECNSCYLTGCTLRHKESQPLSHIMYNMIVYSDASNWSSKEQVVEQFQEALKGIKQRIESLIKFHEDRIEELIKKVEEAEPENDNDFIEKGVWLNQIKYQYESIMAIEHWLEDVI